MVRCGIGPPGASGAAGPGSAGPPGSHPERLDRRGPLVRLGRQDHVDLPDLLAPRDRLVRLVHLDLPARLDRGQLVKRPPCLTWRYGLRIDVTRGVAIPIVDQAVRRQTSCRATATTQFIDYLFRARYDNMGLWREHGLQAYRRMTTCWAGSTAATFGMTRRNARPWSDGSRRRGYARGTAMSVLLLVT